MLNEGMYVSDRYEIIEKIGSGGMSYVYKAKDHTLNRFVAIKVLKSEFSDDQNFLAKFRIEAQSAAGLVHPNIVNVYDVGSENGLNYIVMEYVEGITLKTYIEKKGQLGFKEAVSITIQVAKGIEAAHKNHVIHRDIKPQNILISTDGKVKVTDFGIARAASADTIHSDVMGSVHYASPEQARNGFVDGKSDIYSLGIVMYEMVTGRVPFDADTTVAVAVQHLQEEMVPPSAYAPDLPVSLEGIILKCTQKSPDRRYDSVEDLLTDLKKALINPDENFVLLAPPVDQKTIMVNDDELSQIKEAGKGYDDDEEEEEDAEGEEEEEGGFLNPKMEKAVTIMGIVAAIVIVGIVIFLVGSMLGLFKFGSSSKDASSEAQEDQVEVPDVVGMDKDDAKELLNGDDYSLGFKISTYEYSDEYEEGEIISSDPKAGEYVDKNTTVSVVVSNGPENDATVPSLTGMTESNATAKLKSMDISYTVSYDYSDSVASGNVISQTPSSGSKVSDSTTVKLVVSRGQETLTVPNVVGQDQATAQSTLTSNGLTVGSVTSDYSDTVSEGNVISQSVASGKTVASGTSVDLVISLGKQVTYVSVPSVTGMTSDSAKSTIESLGLSCTVVTTQSSSTTVISQSPAAGSSVTEGSTVTITVGDGSQATTTTPTDNNNGQQ